MMICILTSLNPYASEGASSNRLRSIVDGLVLNGADINMLILNGWSLEAEFRKFGLEGYLDPEKKIKYKYISKQTNFNLWSRRVNLYVLDYLLLPLYSFILNKILKSEKADILFIQPNLSVFRLFKRIPQNVLNNLKVVMEISEYNDIGKEHATNFMQRYNVDSFNDLLHNRILPKLDSLIVMTTKLKSHFSTVVAKNQPLLIYHMPMTVDIARFSNVSHHTSFNSPYIAYCGTTSFKKDGVDILIKSFDKIASLFPNLILYIAAYYENDGDKMVGLIKNARFSERIIYLGTLHRDQIPAFISNAFLCALPRPDSRQAQGGFPTKLGEYLASGRPVCVTTVGEIPEYLEDKSSAFFALPGSIESFALAMKNALMDTVLANEVGSRGKMVAETSFNKDIQGENLFKYLSILIKNA